jgi:hypothetical protein
MSIEILLLFVRDVVHVKSIRIERDVDRESLAFCMRHHACKNYKDKAGRRSGAPYFLYVLAR